MSDGRWLRIGRWPAPTKRTTGNLESHALPSDMSVVPEALMITFQVDTALLEIFGLGAWNFRIINRDDIDSFFATNL